MKRSDSSDTGSKSTTLSTEPWAISPKPWKPHSGQKMMVKFLLEQAVAALLCDPGIGKTSAVLAAFTMLKKRGIATTMLVVAPLKPAYLVWPAEVQKWIDFCGLRIEVLHGPKKEEALARDADIYVINYEGLEWLLGPAKVTSKAGKKSVSVDLKAFRDLGFDTLVIDELTKVKHISSSRHKMLKQISKTCSRVWGLTGTPAPNGLMDLFGQMLVLDQGKTFGPYITHFRNQYFVPSYDGFNWLLKKDSETQIYDRMRPIALRLAAEDYVDLPMTVENVITFDLPKPAAAIYQDIEDELISRIDNHVVTAANAAVAMIKCRQVASGGIYKQDVLTDGPVMKKLRGKLARDWIEIHDEKTDLLEDLVEELQGTPILVAYEFQHDLERLRRRFGRDLPVIGGGTTDKQALTIEREWNAGKLPILAGHPASIGHGLNLQQSGNHICWYSLTWNLEHYDQLNGRIRRQGAAHNRVFIHHLIAKNTVDETIYFMLKSKDKGQKALLDALKERKNRRR